MIEIEVAELIRDANARPDRLNGWEKQFLLGFENRIKERCFYYTTPPQDRVLKNIARKVYAI